jgi:CheY-like chemotaxis protein
MSAAQGRPLRILLVEDDPVDAAWLTELVKEKCLAAEIIQTPSLPDAFAALDQQPIDTVFLSIRTSSIQACGEIVRRAGPRPVVALINVTEMALAAEARATGVKLVYRKHPIWRTAQIRKQELRMKLGRETGQEGV